MSMMFFQTLLIDDSADSTGEADLFCHCLPKNFETILSGFPADLSLWCFLMFCIENIKFDQIWDIVAVDRLVVKIVNK